MGDLRMEEEQHCDGKQDTYVWLETHCSPGGGPILREMEGGILDTIHSVISRNSWGSWPQERRVELFSFIVL